MGTYQQLSDGVSMLARTLLRCVCLSVSMDGVLIAPKNYDAIDLDDLHESQSSSVIALDMKDREKYFEGRASGDAPNGMHPDLVLLHSTIATAMQH